MRITIFIGSISGGGAERVACNLANFFVQKEYSVTMLTMSETQDTYGLENSIKKVSLLKASEKKNRLFSNVLRYKRLKNYIKTTACDCYIVMLPVTISFLLHFKKICKTPIIAAERCDPNSYSRIKRFFLHLYGKRADVWVFQTDEAAKWYNGIAKRSVIIPNAINPAFIRDPYFGKKEKLIVTAGRLSKQKNFKTLLDAFALVVNNFSDYKLKIYGKGPLENELRTYTNDKGIQEKVEFMGFVDNIPEQFETASMFVLSSDFEGIPNALMEAMALGLPCVSTDCPAGGPRFLIEHGKNGLLVPVGDAEKMANAISKLILLPDYAEKIGDNARSIIENFEPSIIYNKWDEVIIKVAKDKCIN